MTLLQQAELRMWIAELESLDWRMRLLAGERVCDLVGLSEAVRALGPGGVLRPSPEWPLVDIAPESCVVDGMDRWLVTQVRTRMNGIALAEEVRVRVPLADGALAEAVERGRDGLRRRLV